MRNNYLREPKVGDIVIIHASDPRIKWRMARILENIYSKDGNVRQCKIISENSIMTRAVNHLYSLEINADDDIVAAKNTQQWERHARYEEAVSSQQDMSQTVREDLQVFVDTSDCAQTQEQGKLVPEATQGSEPTLSDGQFEGAGSQEASRPLGGCQSNFDTASGAVKPTGVIGQSSAPRVQCAQGEGERLVAGQLEAGPLPVVSGHAGRPRRAAAINSLQKVRKWIKDGDLDC